MLRFLSAVILVLMFCAPTHAEDATRARVMVVASIHGLHADRPTYSYDDLYRLVRAFGPHRVGVEIRPEDMARDPAYLANNYPVEMIALAAEHGARAFGFDWLGEEIEGRAIPSDWWSSGSRVKSLERARDEDPQYASDDVLNRLDEERSALLGEDITASSLNDGRYDLANRRYYDRLNAWLSSSPYAPLTEFYRAREDHIARNIVAAIRAAPGRRFVIVLGADHRVFVLDALRAELADAVEIVPVP